MVKVLLETEEVDERVYLELTDDQLRLLEYLAKEYWLIGGDATVTIIDHEPKLIRI